MSPFCLGMVRAPETVEAAFDAGINFFLVSADMHWPLYRHTRTGLEQLLAARPSARGEIVVAVVSYTTQPEFCYAPFLEVLEEMPRLARIDVAVMGGVYASDFTSRLEIYRGHVRTGHAGIRSVGATFHDRLAARSALSLDAVELALVRYNPLHPGAREDLFPFRPTAGHTRLFNFNSTAGFVQSARFDALGLDADHWRPAVTDYYRFALSRPEIDGVLCAPQTPAEVAALVRGLEEGPLSPDEETYLINLAMLDSGDATLDRAEP